ncbi:hypothetical protein [Streptomyces griseorubiginosus]|uniref:hypothetical protein n=1 Tax=Streptomyces griseorubiginosus TaxID=67304 RepID=UPI0036E05B5E
MPDLHGWITQQIDYVEEMAREQESSLWQTALGDDSVAAAMLRRCAADRKILTIHTPAGDDWEPYGCNGCGIDSEYGYEVRHTNDCETLLALAEGYGLTEKQRAALDRPQPRPPKRSGPSLIPDALTEAMYGRLYATFLGTQPVEPRPEVKALEIFGPELKKIAAYVPVATDEPWDEARNLPTP